MDLLARPVLRLNRNWQIIGVSSVQEALIAMNSHDRKQQASSPYVGAAVGMDMQYQQTEDGSWDFENCNPVPSSWENWLELPIRPFDEVVHTSRLTIRVPRVIIAVNYARMHKRRPKLNAKSIRERDGNKCQYTGRALKPSDGSLDHVIPRSRGGRDDWENLVWAAKEVNQKKADKTPEEAGLSLLSQPRAPLPIPFAATIRRIEHNDWRFFFEH